MRFPLRRRLLLVLLAAAVFAALLATADCKKGGRKKSKTSGGMVQPGDMSAANELFNRAMSLKQAGQLPEAIKAMEELCGRFPNEWDPQNHLGLMCARRPSPPIPQHSSFVFTPLLCRPLSGTLQLAAMPKPSARGTRRLPITPGRVKRCSYCTTSPL
jgi:hypothetical protein